MLNRNKFKFIHRYILHFLPFILIYIYPPYIYDYVQHKHNNNIKRYVCNRYVTLRDRENEELKIATCKIDQHAYKWLECF